MTRQNLLLLASLCCSLTIAACSDDPVPSNSNNNPILDMNTPPEQDMEPDQDTTLAPDTIQEEKVEAFLNELAEAWCTRAQQCCMPSEFSTNFFGDDCVERFIDDFDGYFPSSEELSSRMIKLNDEEASELFDTIRAPNCPQLPMDINLFALTGLVEENSTCSGDRQCASVPRREVACILESCRRLKTVGEDCFLNRDCEDGLYCPNGFQNGTCAPRLLTGDKCGQDTDCASSICVLEFIGVGLCAAPRANGESCAEARQCLSGFCDRQVERCIATKPVLFFCAGF